MNIWLVEKHFLKSSIRIAFKVTYKKDDVYDVYIFF